MQLIISSTSTTPRWHPKKERVNVEKRTQRRIALLFPREDKTVEQATQTEILMREVLVEVIEYLNKVDKV
jgi:hypothetical protein